jgi:hypothetical protein
LQRLGTDGRYYVPRRRQPAIDPALARVALGENQDGSASAPEVANPIPDDDSQPPHRSELQVAEHDMAPAQPVGAAEIAATSLQSTADHVGTAEPGHATTSHAPPLQPAAELSLPPQSEEGLLLIERPKRRREPAHLKFVISQPCLICGRTPSDAHHLRFAQPRALGRKVSDEFTVPLCRTHHRQVHQAGNESKWWQAMDRDVDPLEIAKGLWQQSQLHSGKASGSASQTSP